MNTPTTPKEIGEHIGSIIAREVVDMNRARKWPGLTDADHAELEEAGIAHGSAEWREVEYAAEMAFLRVIVNAPQPS